MKRARLASLIAAEEILMLLLLHFAALVATVVFGGLFAVVMVQAFVPRGPPSWVPFSQVAGSELAEDFYAELRHFI
jgi:hypothetical protein